MLLEATPELYQRGMNFGVRYSFDHGECTGSNVRYLGPCKWSFARYGHIVGCNNFRDHYPWPQARQHARSRVLLHLMVHGNPTAFGQQHFRRRHRLAAAM